MGVKVEINIRRLRPEGTQSPKTGGWQSFWINTGEARGFVRGEVEPQVALDIGPTYDTHTVFTVTPPGGEYDRFALGHVVKFYTLNGRLKREDRILPTSSDSERTFFVDHDAPDAEIACDEYDPDLGYQKKVYAAVRHRRGEV